MFVLVVWEVAPFYVAANMLPLPFGADMLLCLIVPPLFVVGVTIYCVAVVADAIKIHYRTEPILPTEVTMVSAYGDILSMVPQFILWITPNAFLYHFSRW